MGFTRLFSLVLLFSKVMASQKREGGEKEGGKKPARVCRIQNKNISKLNVQIA